MFLAPERRLLKQLWLISSLQSLSVPKYRPGKKAFARLEQGMMFLNQPEFSQDQVGTSRDRSRPSGNSGKILEKMELDRTKQCQTGNFLEALEKTKYSILFSKLFYYFKYNYTLHYKLQLKEVVEYYFGITSNNKPCIKF